MSFGIIKRNTTKAPASIAQRHFQVGLWLAIVGTALFSLKSIFIKLAFAAGADVASLLALRMFIAAPFYLGILVWLLRQEKAVMPVPKQWLAALGLGFIGYYSASVLDMQGLTYISAQLERLTLYSYPIITTLLSWLFLRESITKRVWLALLLTYSGVMLLYVNEMDRSDLAGAQVTLGVVLVLGAALSYSLYLLLSKPLIGKIGSRLFTSIAMLVSTVFVAVHFAWVHDFSDLLNLPVAVWMYGFLLAVFCTIIPSYMISEAIHRIGAARTSITGTLGPIMTIALAVWLLGEPFGWVHAVGVVLVMSGVAVLGKK